MVQSLLVSVSAELMNLSIRVSRKTDSAFSREGIFSTVSSRCSDPTKQLLRNPETTKEFVSY